MINVGLKLISTRTTSGVAYTPLMGGVLTIDGNYILSNNKYVQIHDQNPKDLPNFVKLLIHNNDYITANGKYIQIGDNNGD